MRIILFLLPVLGMLGACTPTGTETSKAPDPPKMVQKEAGADTTLGERGIDAEARRENAIRIMWYRQPATQGVVRYKIYRSQDADGLANYRFIGQQEAENNEDTTFVDLDSLSIFTKYFYFITAVNEEGKESLPSDTVWYNLLPKATPGFPKGQVVKPDSLGFTFNVPSDAFPNGYIFRIERLIGANFRELVYLYMENPLQGGFGQTQYTYTMNNKELQIFEDDIEYRWRIDLLAGDPLHNGSESDWATFSIDWGN